MSASYTIPVFFVPARLAVTEEEAHELLGLNNGRPEAAKKKAFYRFCQKHGIAPEPGRVYPLRKIEAACHADPA